MYFLSAAIAVLKLSTAIAYDNGVAVCSVLLIEKKYYILLVQATPPMGWSSWCTNDLCGIPDLCSEFEVRNKADAMVENGMRDLGYKWMLLDDCW